MKRVGFAVFLLVALTSCKHDPFLSEILIDNGGITTEAIQCDEDSVYFVNEVLPLFQSSCGIIGCHDAGTAEDGIVLTSYANIMASGEIEPFNPGEGDIMENIRETDPDDIMPPPPNAPLGAEQIQTIETWILQGAQNNSCLSCDFPEVAFSQSVFPLIQNKCEGCHSGSTPSGDILLTNYSQVEILVNDGSLMGAVNWQSGYTAMPYNGNQLLQCEREMIQQWVDEGAPNN